MTKSAQTALINALRTFGEKGKVSAARIGDSCDYKITINKKHYGIFDASRELFVA